VQQLWAAAAVVGAALLWAEEAVKAAEQHRR
jgi:hypothetical protein